MALGVVVDINALICLLVILGVPRVLLNLLKCEPCLRVDAEDTLQERGTFACKKVWDFEVAFQNLLVQNSSIGIFEGKIAAEHGIESNATAPDVNFDAIVAFARNHLGRCVARTAAGGLEKFAGLVRVRQTEIDDLEILVLVQKEVLWLQITMCHVPLMQELNAGHNLVIELETLTLREPVFSYNIIKQFTTTGVLHDQVNVALRLDDLVEFDYVLVPNTF